MSGGELAIDQAIVLKYLVIIPQFIYSIAETGCPHE